LINRLICIVIVLFAALILPAYAASGEQLPEDYSDPSRSVFVHVLPLINEQNDRILPSDEPLMPFSTRNTCGFCHNYEKVSGGWHFNSADPNIDAGRVGQPWIFVDKDTATQIPLSYRNWPGTFKPLQIGLDYRQFTTLFARHFPGGGPGEIETDDPDQMFRELVSGKLEINCLACHNPNPQQDHAEYASQIAKENFRWAATAASDIASVKGSAKKMPDTWDYLMPLATDNTRLSSPTVTYNKNAFDNKNFVFIDILREVPEKNCYFCHSNFDIDKDKSQKWMTDEDVHLAAGLKCVDCHRNGLGHDITRGYETEQQNSQNPLAVVSSCKGCHLGDEDSPSLTAGRLGAPVPKHPGIPPEHFEKLSCTACHSGPWPESKTKRTKTSRAHGLGIHNINKSPNTLPHIMTTVFARQEDGKIAPAKLVWPAFWAESDGQNVTPIPIETVRQTAGKIIVPEKSLPDGNWPELTEQKIAEVLNLFASKISSEAKPAYICGGKLYGLDEKGILTASEHEAAKPYAWPIAHNTRPAAQSLGARQCEDCHSTDSPFSFGLVEIDSPVANSKDTTFEMIQLQGLDRSYTKAFAFTFIFRPWLKIVALACSAIVAAVLILYGFKALACIVKILAGGDE
jgi:hypothetical protein